jgi:DNA-binding NarL/FixJ family response regulator
MMREKPSVEPGEFPADSLICIKKHPSDDSYYLLRDLSHHGALSMLGQVLIGALICGDRAVRVRLAHYGIPGRRSSGVIELHKAILFAVNAAVLLRKGDLRAAKEHADQSLNIVNPQHWGVAVGVPLSAALLAATRMGRLRDAESAFNAPVPEAMFDTPFALNYLNARANYELTTGDRHAALADFKRCGDLMRRWSVDQPCIVPWRTGAVEACLQLGLDEQARDFAGQQAILTGSEHPRTRGIALRAQAAVSDIGSRSAKLREAIDLLSAHGDPVELTLALLDLVYTHDALGQHRQARMFARRAGSLAADCGIALSESGLAAIDGPEPPAPPEEEPADDSFAELSDAQWRVARLAALGYRNREIARKLHITVSTVEQHLSQAYRKLNVSCRTDLPFPTGDCR